MEKQLKAPTFETECPFCGYKENFYFSEIVREDHYRFKCGYCGKTYHLSINLKFKEVHKCPICEEDAEKTRHTTNKVKGKNKKTIVKIFQEYVCENCKPEKE